MEVDPMMLEAGHATRLGLDKPDKGPQLDGKAVLPAMKK